MRFIERILGILALIGLALAFAVHSAAASGLDLASDHPEVWCLFLGVPIVFVPFVSLSRRRLGSDLTWDELREAFPGWVILAVVMLAVYVWFGWWAGMAPMPTQGVASKQGERYVIVNHGHVLSEISATKYHELEASRLRGISSLWLIFYGLPCAFFLFRRDDADEESGLQV